MIPSMLATESVDLPSDFFAGLDENPILPQSITTVPNGVYGPLLPGEQFSPVAPDLGIAANSGGSGGVPLTGGSPPPPSSSLWSNILGFAGLATSTVAAVKRSTATQSAGSQRPQTTTAKAPISSTGIILAGLALLVIIIFIGRRRG